MAKTKKINKDAGSGKIVSNDYAKKHQKTTYAQIVPVKKATKKK